MKISCLISEVTCKMEISSIEEHIISLALNAAPLSGHTTYRSGCFRMSRSSLNRFSLSRLSHQRKGPQTTVVKTCCR